MSSAPPAAATSVPPPSDPAVRLPPKPRNGRVAAWTLLDQGLASLATFGLTIAVARAVDPRVGGIFTYVFVIFQLSQGLAKAVGTDPLLIRFSAVDAVARARATAQAAATSANLGMLVGVVSLAVGLVLGDQLGLALILLLAVLPGQLLQDAWRSAAFAAAQPHKAAANDALRVVTLAGAIGVCIASGTQQLGWYLAAWATGAWVGALLGMVQFGRPAGPRGSFGWLRGHLGLNLRLGAGYVINMGAVALTTSLLVALLGFAATGGLRFAQTLLGPMQVLFSATTAFMLPLLARRLAAQGPGALRRPAVVMSALATTAAGVVVATLLLLPEEAGQELLGRSWAAAREVLPAVGAVTCLMAVSLGASVALLALGRADSLLRVTLVQAPLLLGCGVVGALWLGIEGAAWGLAVAQVVGACVVWAYAWRGARKSPGKAPHEVDAE
ncbi:hypothetical protein [Blastococcus tunisiensis]|uniref:Membrane protein involved in the export of O-antigen and teichoic acid n=1 Tax=Blastococcus tunisiensis TaxID=1798228 RepID=A0A1I1XEX9_9ACTN|nr:hypothetical protein [Blastococcus sp. DSM 46838]SFE04293.1 Membrane protein involved in the export of O-antigen and teichoic acid [Blastococcus sp. DSM 46838]